MEKLKSKIAKKGSNLMIRACVATILISFMSSWYLSLDEMMWAINMFVGLFVVGKMGMSMMFTQGWKVFKSKTILGMPRLLFGMYVILAILLVALITTSIQMPSEFESAERNILGFAISAIGGLISTFIAWYLGINMWMATGSEYDARLQFEKKGLSNQEIESAIVELTTKGII